MIQKPKGTADLLPEEIKIWHYIEETARIILGDYQFEEMRTPMFESYELFSRGVGDTSDIVSKEMYDFYDKGDRHITLRPEGTAAIVRAYVENKLFGPEHKKPYKVYYMAPMFRYERPQSGRLRQFHQLGVEVFGSTNPATDVETIAMAWDLLKELGLSNMRLVINSLGKTADRIAYRQALIDYLEPFTEELSEDSKNRLHKNPLRVLDSKDKRDIEIVKNAPRILEFLSDEARTHFEKVQQYLTALEIPFEIDETMVRGLDYYQDTIFEIMVDDQAIGAKSTICGGGRYDGLVEALGGPATPGFGFGIGVERLLLLLKQQEVEVPEAEPLDVYVMGLGQASNIMALRLVQAARKEGLLAERDYLERGLKAQFKQADKLKAQVILTIGEDELAAGTVQAKHPASGKQVTLPLDQVLEDFMGTYRQLTVDTSVIDKYFKGEF